MFTGIRLKNFKCYANTGEIPLRPLTVLVGPNNAGKSTLLHAILMLKQTLQDKAAGAALITSGPFVELGGFHDIIRGGRKAKKRTLSIGVAVSPEIKRRIRLAGVSTGSDLSVSFLFDSEVKSVRVSSVCISDGSRPILDVRRRGRRWNAVSVPTRARKYVDVDFFHFFPLLRPVKMTTGYTKLVREISNMTMVSQIVSHVWSHTFEDVMHVAPLRLPVPWYGLVGRMPTSDLGPGGENLLRVLGSVAATDKRKKALIKIVDSWVSRRLKMLKRLRLVDVDAAGTVRSLHADERFGFREINVAGMGEGLSQLLPIVAGVLRSGDRQCILVEQPEIHLHPAAQAALGDLFVQHVKKGKGRQLIVETHSEHLLLRIRRRIADRTISPDKVAVLYVERQGKESTVRRLVLDTKGHFEDWPMGFFEEGYKEALSIAEAASKRGRDQS